MVCVQCTTLHVCASPTMLDAPPPPRPGHHSTLHDQDRPVACILVQQLLPLLLMGPGRNGLTNTGSYTGAGTTGSPTLQCMHTRVHHLLSGILINCALEPLGPLGPLEPSSDGTIALEPLACTPHSPLVMSSTATATATTATATPSHAAAVELPSIQSVTAVDLPTIQSAAVASTSPPPDHTRAHNAMVVLATLCTHVAAASVHQNNKSTARAHTTAMYTPSSPSSSTTTLQPWMHAILRVIQTILYPSSYPTQHPTTHPTTHTTQHTSQYPAHNHSPSTSSHTPRIHMPPLPPRGLHMLAHAAVLLAAAGAHVPANFSTCAALVAHAWCLLCVVQQGQPPPHAEQNRKKGQTVHHSRTYSPSTAHSAAHSTARCDVYKQPTVQHTWQQWHKATALLPVTLVQQAQEACISCILSHMTAMTSSPAAALSSSIVQEVCSIAVTTLCDIACTCVLVPVHHV